MWKNKNVAEKIKLKFRKLSKHIIRSMTTVDLNNSPIKEFKKNLLGKN